MKLKIEKALIRKAKYDDEAFSQVYEMIYRDLYKYALYMLGNQHDAEDIVSEVVIDIYKGLINLQNESAFLKWVYTILSAKCKRKRMEYLNKHISIDDEKMKMDFPNQEVDLDIRQDLIKALCHLSEDEREILILFYINGYKSREIEEILNIKSSTVRSKQKRALEKLKNMMEVG